MEDAFYVRLRDDTVQRWEFGAIVASCKYAGEWPPPDNVSR